MINVYHDYHALFRIGIMPRFDHHFSKILILEGFIFEISIICKNDDCLSSFYVELENGCHALTSFLLINTWHHILRMLNHDRNHDVHVDKFK